MNRDKLIELFRRAEAECGDYKWSHIRQGMNERATPGFDALREATLDRANFAPPYRIAFKGDGSSLDRSVLLVPQAGKPIVLSDVPVQDR